MITWKSPLWDVSLRLFLTCWLIYALHFATNTVREIFPALSLGDHLSFDVSEYVDLHPDIFEIQGRGAFINNNPGASILGAIPYLAAKPLIDRIVQYVQSSRAESVSPPAEYKSIYPSAREFYAKARERSLDIKFGLAAGVMQILLMAPLSALSAALMFQILARLTGSARAGLFLALLYAFATPVFFRTAQLNHNLILTHCAFFAFVVLWRPWDDPAHLKRPKYWLAGLLCGWALLLDYSGLIVAPVLGGYALARRSCLPLQCRSRTDMFEFTIGFMLVALTLAAYQWASFGSPFYAAQHYMPPTRFSGYGYKGIDWPAPDLLWKNAFGMQYGLFTSAPLLLLALYFPGWLRRNRIVGSGEFWCIVGFSALFFLFCAMNQYTRMQFNTGVRHIVPVTPFLFLITAGGLLQMPLRLAALIGIFATYWSWCLAMYRDVEHGLGILESIRHVTLEGFRLPWLTTLENMGYLSAGASSIPLVVVCGAILWTIWKVGPPINLSAEGPSEVANPSRKVTTRYLS